MKEGRYVTEGFGLYPTIVNPPYTTLTAYDLNKGTIKWQIGLGDDLRLVGQGITGTGTAASLKGGIITTATGLVFVTAADRKVHVYDSATGKQMSELQLGGPTHWSALDVRAGRATVSSRHGIGCGRPRRAWRRRRLTRGPHRDRGLRAAAQLNEVQPEAVSKPLVASGFSRTMGVLKPP